MPNPDILEALEGEDPQDFAALEVSCGKFIDVWLGNGGAPTDDEVVGFYSLWSQSLDARGRDERDFYQWAYPLFVRHRDKLRNLSNHA